MGEYIDQLLFDEETLATCNNKTNNITSIKEKIKEIKWSYSKRSSFEKCLRCYYYDYFGGNKTTAQIEPFKKQIHFIKTHVQNRYLLAGSILHKIIKLYLQNSKKNNLWENQRYVNFAKKIYNESWEFSKKCRNTITIPDGRYPPKLLLEYYTDMKDADELCIEEQKRLIISVTSFLTNDLYSDFRVKGSKQPTYIEENIKVSGFPCKIGGKIDLAYEEDNQVTIIDWKLGANDGTGNNSLQLATYGLWASTIFNSAFQNFTIFKIHLSTNEIVKFKFNKIILAETKARIIQDTERMYVLQEYGKQGIKDAFTCCNKPKVCKLCLYRRICYA